MQEETTASAILFVGIAVLLIAVVLSGTAAPGGATRNSASAPPATDEQAVAAFWRRVAETQPQAEQVVHVCPVDGAQVSVPAIVQDNRLGGVASDMMQLALAPPVDEIGPPDLTKQRFNMDLGVCPKCHAAFSERDLAAISIPEVKAAVAKWDLALAVPALAKVPDTQWTEDERALVHFLFLRQAGVSPAELGIAALNGAYCCNHAVSRGLKRRFASPAFYALAATCFADGLELDRERDPASANFCAMMLGETSRLLGRAEDAAAAYAQARQLGKMDDATRHVLEQMETLQKDGKSTLERLDLLKFTTPPLGWYLDLMLPAINGDIEAARAQWAGLRSVDAILEQMQTVLNTAG